MTRTLLLMTINSNTTEKNNVAFFIKPFIRYSTAQTKFTTFDILQAAGFAVIVWLYTARLFKKLK